MENINEKKRIQVSEINNRPLRIITSRSHENKLPHSFLDQIDDLEIIDHGNNNRLMNELYDLMKNTLAEK